MPVDKTMWTERARTLAFFVLALSVVVLIALVLTAKPAPAATFTVNSTADTGDSTPDGTCDSDPTAGVVCTLREAMQEANANNNDPTVDDINFAIPGAGPHTISPGSDLPAIVDPVTIDGYTQGDGTTGDPSDDATENTLAVGNNAVLKIELDGTNAHDGLRIQAANSTVKGLIINRFGNPSVSITGSGATGNKVEGNYIGSGNGGDGVEVNYYRDSNDPDSNDPTPATGNRILSNSIYDNDALGIDLFIPPNQLPGVTNNDPKDPDTGPNRLQNFPKLTSATTDTTTTRVSTGDTSEFSNALAVS
jgi:CSLREA domain-containing protein